VNPETGIFMFNHREGGGREKASITAWEKGGGKDG